MEIRVEERTTGRQMRREILDRYGSRAALERRAASRSDPEAKDDLFELRMLDEDPTRLDLVVETTTIMELEPGDIGRLTPERIRLLDHLASEPQPPNLSQLSAALGRDKKNISIDLRVLEGLGLLSISKRGRDIQPRIRGNHIHLVVPTDG